MVSKKDITGIILAGGKSSRMGTDKGLLELNGKSFIAHIIDAVKPLVNTLIIVSDHTDHDQFGFERIEDSIKDAGPLAGLYSGLNHSTTNYNLVVSCDMPLITTNTLETLVRGHETKYEVTQLEYKGKTMPLTALYRKDCELKIKALLDNGEKRMRYAVSQLETKTIIVDNRASNALVNINTREQLNDIKHAIKH